MGSLELTTAEELEMLKMASRPGFHQSLVNVGNDKILKLNATLELLEIRLINITLISQLSSPDK